MGLVKTKIPLPTTSYDYYEVFAREEIDGALAHIGCLSAPNPELALSQAMLMYSEKIWSEMCMVRRDDVIPIIAPNNILGAA